MLGVSNANSCNKFNVKSGFSLNTIQALMALLKYCQAKQTVNFEKKTLRSL